jgi:hypothetical protein
MTLFERYCREHDTLAATVAPNKSLADLVIQARAAAKVRGDTAESRHAKFAESTFVLAYTGLPTFFEGLQGRVGQPSPNLRLAMRTEHCSSTDSDIEFTTRNYGITTTPKIEWHAVLDPVDGLAQLKRTGYPEETFGIAQAHKRANRLRPLKELLPALQEKNERLNALGEPPLLNDELLAGRLYSGPMFLKYNLVCRAVVKEAPPFMKADFERCCRGNKFTTTIHVLNSLVVKCSKLTVTTKVFRGSARGVLPDSFWEPNDQGVRGGVEPAFMSTTTDRDVAVGYAGVGTSASTPMVFQFEQGMINRGAELDWLSQYPHEHEGERLATLLLSRMRLKPVLCSQCSLRLSLASNCEAPILKRTRFCST